MRDSHGWAVSVCGALFLMETTRASRGWSGCLFKLTCSPFSLASLFLAALLLTRSRNSCRHLECLTCSTRTLTRFSMYRPLTTL